MRQRLTSILVIFSVLLSSLAVSPPALAATLAQRLTGKILLQVEQNGEAWYVYPDNLQRYYLGRPDDAFSIMRNLGLGITDADLAQVPEAGSSSSGNLALRQRLSGMILLQVEQHGEAWYVYPDNLQRYYLGRPDDAFSIMRNLGLGITTQDLLGIPVASDSATPPGSDSGNVTQGNLNDAYATTRVQLLTDMNAARASHGLSALQLITELNVGTQAQADDMTTKGYFDFTSPDGTTLQNRVEQAGYMAYAIGQNLIQTNQGVDSVVQKWVADHSSSYQNLINPDYEHVGIGVGTYQGVPFYLVFFAQSLETYFTQATADLQNLSQVRAAMLARVNQERANIGLAPLVINGQLEQAAQGHADDMLHRAYYSHDTPEGLSPFDRILATGYNAMRAGENIAKGQFSVTEVMDAWMNSPEHKANILGDYKDVGFGLAFGKNQNGYEIYWVQDFGSMQ